MICHFGGILLITQVNGCAPICANNKVSVGSTNPIKIKAVKNAFNDENLQIIPCQASSNVPQQPLSNEETLQGAMNRARDCLEKTDSTLGIGLEAGIVFINEHAYLCHWGAIVDRYHNTFFSNGPLILLPKEFIQPLLEGQILEDIMHKAKGIEKLGTKQGAISIFTQNYLNREEVLTQLVKALIGQYAYYLEQAN